MLYFIIRPWIRFTLWMFYKPLKVVGLENIPKNVPVILAPNHQNSFLDAILPACFQPRSLHFLTRSDVFKKGLVEKILYSLHMWPIYRQRDGKDNLGKNEEIFRRCSELLRNDGCLLLFPESVQVCAHHLRPLKKGMARIAFQAAQESNFEKEIYIVPLGLNYESYSSFNTAFQMRFGKPIKVLDFKQDFEESEQKGYQNLTRVVQDALQQEMVHVEDKEDEKFWFEQAGLTGEEVTTPEFFRNIDLKSRPAKKKKKKDVNVVTKILYWPVSTLVYRILKKTVKDNKFLGSVKFGLGMILLPVYYLVTFFLLFALTGIWWIGLSVVAVMILSLKMKL
jgi:1-acyl-sn-glycerol-3-phosphate acyltransferase